MTNTSREAVERHLNLDHNHEAGLIPAASQAMIRALLAERDNLQTKLAEAREALEAIVVDDTWGLDHDVYMMCRAALNKIGETDDK